MIQAIKKINNNVALCIDSNLRQVIAFGKGIGFGSFPRELSPSELERTFYDVQNSHISLLQKISDQLLQICVDLIKEAQIVLPYEISSYAVLPLADHIQFAIQRLEKGIVVQMPMAYHLRSSNPEEMALAEKYIQRIRQEMRIMLPEAEAVGIAMNLISARLTLEHQSKNNSAYKSFEEMLQRTTVIIEEEMGVTIDRNTFYYARFASHMHYLYQRILKKEILATDLASMYQSIADEHTKLRDCVDSIVAYIESVFSYQMTQEEKLFLLLHTDRIIHKGEI